MVIRNSFDDVIDKIAEVHSHHEGLNSEKSMDDIVYTRDHFDIKLLVVGHFSAGKSSLLNMLMGKPNFLKVAQEPQTALATELIYDEKEAFYAYDLKGKKEEIRLEEMYSPERYHHLEYRLNMPVLKEINGFTIVDTPGFDAGIDIHTKALTHYIGLGSAYIVVIDQEKGGIDRSTLSYIKEISNYSSQIAVAINKCDKITPQMAESIAESSRFTLDANGLPYEVYTLSKRDVDISYKMKSIISSFDPQFAFNQTMFKLLKAELSNTEKVLLMTKRKLYFDTFNLDAEIMKHTRLLGQLADNFKKKKDEGNKNLDNTVQDIMSSIRAVLISQADAVAEALVSGNKSAAEAIIVESIRPTMLSAMKEVSLNQIDRVTQALDFSGVLNDVEEVDFVSIMANISNTLKDSIQRGSFDTKTVADLEAADKKRNMYRAFTAIAALTTNLIAPWAEIIIILLPDIMRLLQGIFSESALEIAKKKYVNLVVPQLSNKLFPQVRQNVEMTITEVLDNYEKMLSDKLDAIQKTVLEAQAKKKEQTDLFEQYEMNLEKDIESIQKLIEELEERECQ